MFYFTIELRNRTSPHFQTYPTFPSRPDPTPLLDRVHRGPPHPHAQLRPRAGARRARAPQALRAAADRRRRTAPQSAVGLRRPRAQVPDGPRARPLSLSQRPRDPRPGRELAPPRRRHLAHLRGKARR